MASNLRGAGEAQGIGQALKNMLGKATTTVPEQKDDKAKLINRAGESKSPYVRAHSSNPVAWQLWGDEAINLARRENKLLFVSIGYSSCHCKYSLLRSSASISSKAHKMEQRVSYYGARVIRKRRSSCDLK